MLYEVITLDVLVVEQLHEVGKIGAWVVIGPLRVELRTAAASQIRRQHVACPREVSGQSFEVAAIAGEPGQAEYRITSYNVCYTKLLRLIVL